MTRIAVIQESSVLLDRKKTIEKAVRLIEQAVSGGAALVIFPEAFISGYPAWIWRLRPGSDFGTSQQLHERLFESAVDIEAGDLQLVCNAAKKNKVTVVCGLDEREGKSGRATLFNTVVVIGKDGTILNRHRKLMPTNPERMVWGFGDGSGLNVVDTPAGRVGTLLCWENYMPLARYALYAQGVELYIAPTYDSGAKWLGTMQHIAREGRCWVVSSGVALTHSDIPADFPNRDTLYPATEEWINQGDSAVIAPGGEIVAGPLHKEKGILFAEVDARRSDLSKRDFDVTGHYSRPDIFKLTVEARAQNPVHFQR